MTETYGRIVNDARATADLFVGSRFSGAVMLDPNESKTAAATSAKEDLPPVTGLFATHSLDVAIFAAAVWSRDGWSGWNTYADGDTHYYDFFAAPRVLFEAVTGDGGTIYRVARNYFEPYASIPGQYISYTSVPVLGEYKASIWDMRSPIIESAKVLYDQEAARRRYEALETDGPNLNLQRLFNLSRYPNPRPDLSPRETSAMLASLSFVSTIGRRGWCGDFY